MPKLVNFVVCRSILTDIFDNSWSYIGVLDTVIALPVASQSEGVMIPEDIRFLVSPLSLVGFWVIKEGESNHDHAVRFEIEAPDGRTSLINERLKLEMPVGFFRVVHRTNFLGVRGPGLYRIWLKYRASGSQEWLPVGEYLFQVEVPPEGNHPVLP